ncbi:hypothetical protein [Nocardioides pantholopis]|uniref:hypothetical protein n=1 Tax=Nocardioides pantholopis TaxID=2483798 RepID=UPI000FDC970E|nr:hypothetical protein [Nocardioides pantholopis]
MSEIGSVEEQARDFGEDVSDLVSRCFPSSPAMSLTVVGDRIRIRPDGQGDQSGGIPLLVGEQHLAWLRLHYSCRPDVTGKYLAIDSGNFWVVSKRDRSPLFRFEFSYKSRSAPHSHIQVHGERGALTHLLTRTGHDRPHEMSALHLPTGGSRFRPSLEDVIQFLFEDCGFGSVDGWLEAVYEHRAVWRDKQTRAAARAMPQAAAEALEAIGYTVKAPEGGHPEPGRKARFAW